MDELLRAALARCGPRLADPVARSLSGGKRLRPGVTIAAAGRHDDAVRPGTLNAAAAIELLHWATLVHDDVIDGASTRHEQPTVNASEGTAHAVITGDLLIGLAFAQAAHVGAAVIDALADTLTDLCMGQTREADQRFDPTTSVEQALTVAGDKTGSLLAAAARVGALSAGFDPAECDALAEFGRSFGISLQLLDDLLDLVSSPAQLGKPVAADFVNGTLTVAGVAAMQTHEELRELFRVGLNPDEQARALALLRNPDSIAYAAEQARSYADRAAWSLRAVVAIHPTVAPLAGWPSAYLEAQLRTKVAPAWRPALDRVHPMRRVAV